MRHFVLTYVLRPCSVVAVIVVLGLVSRGVHAQDATHTAAATVVASSGERFSSLGIAVDLDDNDHVTFEAARVSGGSGIYVADGTTLRAALETGDAYSSVSRCPSFGERSTVVATATLRSGGQALLQVDGNDVHVLAGRDEGFRDIGECPAVARDGLIVFEAHRDDGSDGLYRMRDGRAQSFLPAAASFRAIAGSLDVDNRGRVAFRATPISGDDGVYVSDGDDVSRVVSLRDGFSELASMARIRPWGVAFVGTQRVIPVGGALMRAPGAQAIFVAPASHDGAPNMIASGRWTPNAFGGLLGVGDDGTIVYVVARAIGGGWALRAYRDGATRELLATGAAVSGSTIGAFGAPSDINARGKLAIEASLNDGRSVILLVSVRSE